MKTRVVDLGWALARIEPTEVDGRDGMLPALTICWPEGEDKPAGSVCLYDTQGLRNLRFELTEALDEFDAEGMAPAD
jgi:hypothetical protein